MGISFSSFQNLSDPGFHFKLMSNYKFTNLTKTKPNFGFSKLPPITNVPIFSFMKTLEETANEYSKSFVLWLIMAITLCSMLGASPLTFLCI